MLFAYLDEFGHVGPWTGRHDRKHNESPVFGLAGIVLPEKSIRPFASFVLKQKTFTFKTDLDASKKMAFKWEKKGTSFIRPKPMRDYESLRRMLGRILKKIGALEGAVFYYGREKVRGKMDGNATGLYTTCLSHAIRNLDRYAGARNQPFALVLDQHSARKELLECAAKTMFGSRPARNLASPPFEVESHLDQNIQAADWVATLIGRLSAFAVNPEDFPDYEQMTRVFHPQIKGLERNCRLEMRPTRPVGSGPFSELASLKREMILARQG